MDVREAYETVLATLTEDIAPNPARAIAITACHRLGEEVAEVERLRAAIATAMHLMSEYGEHDEAYATLRAVSGRAALKGGGE